MAEKSIRDQFITIFDAIDFSRIIDHPNILIAANFWDEERYGAAKTCYKLMRSIDDLIDNFKAANKRIETEEREQFIDDVNNWLNMITRSGNGDPENAELGRIIEMFRIPRWPLEAFAKSMIYDINNDGFESIDTFLDYAQGASVAPASIFVHLSGLTELGGRYIEPAFDVREAASPCAIFSYLVHIIRDFQKDQMNNLNYFADEQMMKNGLSRQDLYNIASGDPVPDGFRKMIRTYRELADIYRRKTVDIITRIRPAMEPRYQLSLEIIFSLYLMVFERIDPENGNFTTYELNPTTEETRKKVYETIMKFNP